MVKFVHGKIIEAPGSMGFPAPKNPLSLVHIEFARSCCLHPWHLHDAKVAQENGTNELPIFTERVAILNLDHLYRVIMSNHFYLPIFTYIYLYLPIFT